MARFHGKDCVVYLGGRDVSGDLVSIDVSASADVHDVTTFASAGWRASDPGLQAWESSLSGLYQTNAGVNSTTIGRQFEDILGVNTAGASVLSVFFDAGDALSDDGILCSDAIFDKRSQPITIGDIVKLSGNLKGSGKMGLNGKLLHPLAARSTTGQTSSIDAGATGTPTLLGGRANLHVTAFTGTGGTIKVQHSLDNSTWADFITFAASTTISSQSLQNIASTNRYIRCLYTINATSSLTFVCAFSRY